MGQGRARAAADVLTLALAAQSRGRLQARELAPPSDSIDGKEARLRRRHVYSLAMLGFLFEDADVDEPPSLRDLKVREQSYFEPVDDEPVSRDQVQSLVELLAPRVRRHYAPLLATATWKLANGLKDIRFPHQLDRIRVSGPIGHLQVAKKVQQENWSCTLYLRPSAKGEIYEVEHCRLSGHHRQWQVTILERGAPRRFLVEDDWVVAVVVDDATPSASAHWPEDSWESATGAIELGYRLIERAKKASKVPRRRALPNHPAFLDAASAYHLLQCLLSKVERSITFEELRSSLGPEDAVRRTKLIDIANTSLSRHFGSNGPPLVSADLDRLTLTDPTEKLASLRRLRLTSKEAGFLLSFLPEWRIRTNAGPEQEQLILKLFRSRLVPPSEWDRTLRLAARYRKPGGIDVTFSGQEWLRQI